MARLFKKLVNERLVAVIIALNTIVIFLRAFPALEAYESILFSVDYVITVYFVFELCAKMGMKGTQTFFRSAWNVFDLVIVLVSLPMLLTPWFDLADFSVFLVLRIARPLRSFRLLRFVPEGERLWVGIKRGLKATLGVALALAMYNFLLAVGACYLFGPASPEHFGDPFLSIYSMFKVFTVEGWYDLPDQIAAGSSTALGVFARCYFAFAVMTGGLLGLSMANGVFIDEMAMDNNDRIESDIAELRGELAELRKENAAAFERIAELVGAESSRTS